MTARVLVAGVGNLFLRDDGFGPEAARRLGGVSLPGSVRVVDYGIRGMHLAYDLLDGYDALVILDAAPRGGRPGDLVVLEVGPEHVGAAELDAHGMAPNAVLGSLRALGGELPRTIVVGCEPADVSEGIGLSPDVAAAAVRAVAVVTELLATELLAAELSTPAASAVDPGMADTVAPTGVHLDSDGFGEHVSAPPRGNSTHHAEELS